MKKQSWLALGALFLTVGSLVHGAVPQNYGAIAYSPSDRKYGVAQKEVNQEAAEQRAMGMCGVTAGGRDCRVAVWFYNACGALAVAPNGAWGADFGLTTAGELMRGINEAFRKAKARCESFGGVGCKLEQASCSFDTP